MLRAALLSLAFALPASADCPAPPDIDAAIDAAVAELRAAETERAARPINGRMWQEWLRAPDARAQAMLDEGLARLRSGDVMGARAGFDALIEYCPDYAEGWNQRAFLSYLTGDPQAALPDLDRAIALRPRHVGALSGRGLVLIALGREAEGHEALRAALALNPWLSERALLPEAQGTEL
jgi:tetratricopeptide (TPR) repeat protein